MITAPYKLKQRTVLKCGSHYLKNSTALLVWGSRSSEY